LLCGCKSFSPNILNASTFISVKRNITQYFTSERYKNTGYLSQYGDLFRDGTIKK
jgi:hypothetical protein